MTENVARLYSVPVEAALKTPASVIAPVPSPAAQSPSYHLSDGAPGAAEPASRGTSLDNTGAQPLPTVE